MNAVLIVDDEADIRTLLARTLELEGYDVGTAERGSDALRMLDESDFAVAVIDVKLTDVDGITLAKVVKARRPEVEVVCMTAFGNISDGVRAMREGAFDYLVKGDAPEKIVASIGRAAEKARLQYRVRQLEKQLRATKGFDAIIGTSAPIDRARDLARRVAATDATVLLTGETGSGKEVFAQAIHTESSRSAEPFVAVNCSALGREILESELFGYKAGAFTGATRDKRGLFEEADRGVLFLDEIGEMDVHLQAKLLRVLETGRFIKVGETRETGVDVRIVAATNKDLRAECEAGRFREDLFYRLSVFHIPLPSLNERREDIPLLADHFLPQLSAKLNGSPAGMSDAFLKALREHDWKGNIRELRNVIERALILCNGNELTEDLLPIDFTGSTSVARPDESLLLRDVERRHIEHVLRLSGGNRARAAEKLGIGVSTLYAKIKEYGL